MSADGDSSPLGHNGRHWWDRLKALFGRDGNASLRESLEDVIEQHEGGENDEEVRPEARSMLRNLLNFSDVRVDDIMVPRADIIALEDTSSVDELRETFTKANHSRIPIYTNTLDDPQGMVHIKDLMRWLTEDRAPDKNSSNGASPEPLKLSNSGAALIRDTGLIRETLFVPPSMPAADLLVKMQSSRIHLAIVIDEYGGTDGIVSIEDVVEEIVGEISDEHDDDDELITKVDDHTYLASARAPIDEVEQMLHVDLLPDDLDEDIDTLGGFVFSMLGRVPVRGELVRHDSGIEFEVIQADARRITRLKIHTRPTRRED